MVNITTKFGSAFHEPIQKTFERQQQYSRCENIIGPN